MPRTFRSPAFFVILALLTACSDKPAEKNGGSPVPVEVAIVEQAEFVTSINALGTVLARESLTITAQVTDIVRGFGFADGDTVKAGQVLVRLGGGEEPAKLREAQVNLDRQRRELKRIEGLVERQLLPAQSLDTQRSLVAEAEAQLDAASARVGERVIRAPFDGVLGLRRVSPGSLVTPGTVITTLDDIDVVRLDFSVPETFLAAVVPGQAIAARSRAFDDRNFTGQVAQVDSRVDPVTRAVTVRAELPNDDHALRPGMLLTVHLIQDRGESPAVPETALVPVAEDKFVFVLREDGTVERRRVEIGRRRPGRVEILAGLDIGERVVTEGTVRVRPGDPVRVLNEAAAP